MSGTKSEIRTLAEQIYGDLLNDLIETTTLKAHREVKRNATLCGVCNTFCRSNHPLPGPSSSKSSAASKLAEESGNGSGSRGSTPVEGRGGGFSVGPEKGTGGSTGIGSGSGKGEAGGNVYFDCLVCSRSVVSSKYAPHLATCLGFGGSTRRGVARSAAAKVRMGTNDRSSPTPWQSENGDSDADSINGSKSGKKNKINVNGKRGMSPSKPPLGKKHKLSSGAATPIQRQPHIPSRLGRPPSTATPTSTASTIAATPSPSPVKRAQPTTLIPGSQRTLLNSSPPIQSLGSSSMLIDSVGGAGGFGGLGDLSAGYGFESGVVDSSTIDTGGDGYESSEGADDDY